MKRVLITGGAGFIGSHLAEELIRRECHVTVLDDESTGRRSNLESVANHRNFAYHIGSVGNADLVGKLLDGTDEVFHLAAAVGVALIAMEPIRTIETNIYPTEMLLAELNRRHQAGQSVKLFLASTSEVYGKNPKPVWSEQDDLVFGPSTKARWSYGASKAIDEYLALAYWRQRRLPLVVGRFFNVVGPRQIGAYGMVLPRFVQAAIQGGPLIVHDDGQQTRCFCHVHDVVSAVLNLMDCEAATGEVFNIGSDQPVSILELAQLVAKEAGGNVPIQFQSYAEAYDSDFEDVRCRVPDLNKLRGAINFRRQHELADIVREAVHSTRR